MALARTSNVSAGRYEFKYFVPRSAAPALRELLRQFTRPDPHAQLWPGFRYPVLTLYCDSPGLAFYEASARGQKSRLKLRLRRYSELPHAPVYIEIKRRVGDAVVKERERADLHAAAALTAALRVGASESKGVHFGAVAARFLAI
ncbi:MAG: VTC domain-containing protein, partial [Candidatus Dadabacteria bacterium]